MTMIMALAGRRRAVFLAAAMLATAASGCSGGGSTAANAQAHSGKSTTTSKSHRATVVNDEITLTCDQQLPGGLDSLTLPKSGGVLHVHAENWDTVGSPVLPFTPTLKSPNGTYEAIETKTVVDSQAAPTTTITATATITTPCCSIPTLRHGALTESS